jgi:5-formyltetrahydrofolate cyclo-ligase
VPDGVGRTQTAAASFHAATHMSLPETSPASVKAALRPRLIQLRQDIPPDDYARMSESICVNLASVPELRRATLIHVYWPMLHRKEPDIRLFTESVLSSGRRIALPVVHAYTAERVTEGRLRHFELTSPASLVQNSWGIHEPEDAEIVSIEDIDAVIVPALGVDRAGNRIGYGRGYYDEFLSEVNATLVCALFSRSIVDDIPREPHDIPIQVIVTEDGCFNVDPK